MNGINEQLKNEIKIEVLASIKADKHKKDSAVSRRDARISIEAKLDIRLLEETIGDL